MPRLQDLSSGVLREGHEQRHRSNLTLRPLSLIAEVTHLSLHCSNSINRDAEGADELTTEDWGVCFARPALGVLQLSLTSEEPLVRKDSRSIASGRKPDSM